ncbi:MAG: protein-L-isoaspartate(D-aspartate) O-methyltransferase [Thermoguttaceae bacterium]
MKRTIATLFALLGLCAIAFAADAPLVEKFPVSTEASAMVDDELLPQGGLTSERVIDVMRRIPRHLFVPDGYRGLAYRDMALAIGSSQTISPPYIVATMTQWLDPQPTDRVLEIGTGSGYQAAVLSLLARDVYTIEIVEPLGREATERLERLGFSNVHVRVGDGYAGWPEAAPFDKIIVTCSPDAIPQPLIDQLGEGGKMIIPVGERHQQRFVVLTKRNGSLDEERRDATYFVPMTGEAESRRRDKPDGAHPQLVGGNFDETYSFDGTSSGHPLGWHYARGTTVVTDDKSSPDGNYLRLVRDATRRIAQVIQGIPVDGTSLTSLRLEWLARTKDVSAIDSASRVRTPTVYVIFYNAERHIVGETQIGYTAGTTPWRRQSGVVTVPKTACDANIFFGLFQATGTLDIDDIRLTVTPRKLP